MSVNAAIAQLSDARKTLLVRWQSAGRTWSDESSRRFEETVVQTIDRDVQRAINGLSQTQSVINRVRQECS